MIALNNHIKESLIKSYDNNKLISVIYKKYHNIEYDYNQYKSSEFLFTIYFNDGTNNTIDTGIVTISQ